MRLYDYKKAKQFIEQNREKIESASLGMHEDWWWTARTIFKDNEFIVDLDDKQLEIGGISGSSWATPVLQIEYKDGITKTYHCHNNGDYKDISGLQAAMLEGCITKEVQAQRREIELEEI